jgi:hypothetical protein
MIDNGHDGGLKRVRRRDCESPGADRSDERLGKRTPTQDADLASPDPKSNPSAARSRQPVYRAGVREPSQGCCGIPRRIITKERAPLCIATRRPGCAADGSVASSRAREAGIMPDTADRRPLSQGCLDPSTPLHDSSQPLQRFQLRFRAKLSTCRSELAPAGPLERSKASDKKASGQESTEKSEVDRSFKGARLPEVHEADGSVRARAGLDAKGRGSVLFQVLGRLPRVPPCAALRRRQGSDWSDHGAGGGGQLRIDGRRPGLKRLTGEPRDGRAPYESGLTRRADICQGRGSAGAT